MKWVSNQGDKQKRKGKTKAAQSQCSEEIRNQGTAEAGRSEARSSQEQMAWAGTFLACSSSLRSLGTQQPLMALPAVEVAPRAAEGCGCLIPSTSSGKVKAELVSASPSVTAHSSHCPWVPVLEGEGAAGRGRSSCLPLPTSLRILQNTLSPPVFSPG